MKSVVMALVVLLMVSRTAEAQLSFRDIERWAQGGDNPVGSFAHLWYKTSEKYRDGYVAGFAAGAYRTGRMLKCRTTSGAIFQAQIEGELQAKAINVTEPDDDVLMTVLWKYNCQ